jgi:hypothetical protein
MDAEDKPPSLSERKSKRTPDNSIRFDSRRYIGMAIASVRPGIRPRGYGQVLSYVFSVSN